MYSIHEYTLVHVWGSEVECVVVLPRPQPHPEGLRCMVLSGCLADATTPKPGKVLPIPKVKRLVVSDAGVLAL